MKATEQRRYHPTKFAAGYLGVSKRYLEGLRVSGDGPSFVRMGKAVRYTVEALDTWATSRTLKSTSEDPRRKLASLGATQ